MKDWDDTNFAAFDFETSGTQPEYALQPWRVAQDKAWPTSLVWSWIDGDGAEREGGGILDVEDEPYEFNRARDVMASMLEFAIREKRRLIGWHTEFDVAWLLAHNLDELVRKAKWLDGMLLWKHLFIEPEYDVDKGRRKSYSLKPWVAEFLPQFANYADDVDFHDRSPAARAKLHAYNVRDVEFTLIAARSIWPQLTPQQRRVAVIEAASIRHVAGANLHGIPIDFLHAGELRAVLMKTAADRLVELAPHGVTEKIVRSPTQLQKLMFDVWKLPVLKETESKKRIDKETGELAISRSTDKEVLHELSFMDPRAKQLRQYREALGNRTKFAEGPLISALYNEDGCAHPQAMIFGTYTSRLTYSSKQGKGVHAKPIGWALHQEKRGADFRDIVVARPGETLVEFDAANQEYRWMAIASGDETMLQMCLPGEDPHGFMGAQIGEEDYRELLEKLKSEDPIIFKPVKNLRQLGKVGNLSLQFRTSAKKLLSVARVQYDIPLELPQAEHIWATYRRTYVRVPQYWKFQIEETKRLGYVETLAGRRVQVRGDWGGSFGWSMGSTSINYRIQGTGGDQKYLAVSCLDDTMHDYGARFAWDLHDGIYFWVPSQNVPAFARRGKAVLDTLPYKKAWGIDPPIPLPWDCKVGPSWGGLKEYQFDTATE